MIKRAGNINKRQIAKLWVKTFGGDKKEVYDFYKNICPVKDTVIDVRFGKVMAMATIIKVKAGDKKGGYVYAVATDEKYRNQGKCRKILSYINHNFNLDFTFLKPSEESLFGLYDKYGYTKILYIPDYSGISLEGFEECSAREYHNLRTKHLENYVEWKRNVIEYILTYAKAYKKGEEICIVQDGKIIEYLGKDMERTVKFGIARAEFDLKDMYFNLAID